MASSSLGSRSKKSGASSGDKKAQQQNKDGLNAILKVTRGNAVRTSSSLRAGLALILKEEMGPGQTMEMFIDVFIDMVQTAGVTADNPKEWSMLSLSAGRTYSSGGAKPSRGHLGIGYIDSQGKVLRFKDNGFQGNANVIANFETNGDIEGIYMERLYR